MALVAFLSALSFGSEEDYWDAVHEEAMGYQGDPRRCAVHGTVISSPDGMFDGLCGACEDRDNGDDDMAEWVARVGIFKVVALMDEQDALTAALAAARAEAFGAGYDGEDIPF